MTAALIGNVGLTLLEVYDRDAGPDGVRGGCAHVHGLTDEAYFGIGGAGAIELHDRETGFRTIPITKGTYVQFPPWTLHRSVSYDGLEVLAVMGNMGLAERGDARIFFGDAADEDPDLYATLKGLVADGEDGALRRRNHSAEAYGQLMRLWHDDRPAYEAALDRFFARHRQTIESTPALAAWRTKADTEGAATVATVGRWQADSAKKTFGMCGMLRQVDKLSAG